MLKNIFALIVSIAFSACVSCNNSGTGAKGAGQAFDSFRVHFRTQPLPIVIKGCNIEPAKFDELRIADYHQFVSYSDNEYAYCSFKANGDYIGIITLGPADCFFPILKTFDKNGNKIDERDIHIGGCGADCGFSCEEFMTLREDYTLYTSDTISYYKCDTAGNEIPGTKEHYVVYKKGRLLPTGKIELTDESKLPLNDGHN